MGRLPKGFRKATQHKDDDDGPPPAPAPPAMASTPLPGTSKEPEEQPLASAFLKDDSAPAAASAGKKGKKGKQQPHAEDEDAAEQHQEENDDEDDGEGGAGGQETRGQMIQRHKRELQAFKKNLPRMGKKSKDEVAKLTAELEARHTKELAALDAAPPAPAAGPSKPPAAAAAADAGEAGEEVGQLNLQEGDGEGAAGHNNRKTKAMKRREKAQAEQAEREARIAAEAEAAGPSARQVEEEALVQLLLPLGLRMRDIRADGHCLYRSLEDQLVQAGRGGGGGGGGGEEGAAALDYLALRAAAARHIRAHADEYAAYVDVEVRGGAASDSALALRELDGESPDEALERYCRDLEGTAAWGGQLELSVLAQVLKRPIQVFSVGMAPLTLGEEFSNGSAAPLKVCFLRHAFGLGEHYNSLESLPSPAA